MARADHGRQRARRWLVFGSSVAVCAAVLMQASIAAADVDSVLGSAVGVAITGDLGVVAPTPTVSLSANESSPPAAFGPFAGSAASITLGPLFSTGVATVVTSAEKVAGDDDAGFVQSGAVVQNVVLADGFARATTIASSCTADGAGARGTTLIQGGVLNGQPFPPTPNPPPNTVVSLAGLGTVTLNEQMGSSSLHEDGSGSSRIVVNAVHAHFEGGAGGILPVNQSADFIIGQVTCEAARSPAPTTTTTTTAAVTTTVAHENLATTGTNDRLPAGVLVLGLAAVLVFVVRRSSDRPSSS